MSNKSFLQTIKPMEEADLKQIWLMRNDAEVLKYAETDNPISWEEFEAVFKYTYYPKLVFKNDSTNEIIGYVEFRNDMSDDIVDTKEWAFFIAPEHRGKGWSEIMLDLAIDYAREQGYNYIRATVKADNEISHHLHNKLGFKIHKDNKRETIYIYNLK